jgi:hypothetical protein
MTKRGICTATERGRANEVRSNFFMRSHRNGTQDVILSYKKDQTKPACNGYCERAYTAEDAEFARVQIEHLLKSCQ